MKNMVKTICLLVLLTGASVAAMGNFRGAASRLGGYLRRPQVPVNTFAFGKTMPHNPSGAQQQTWWQRFKDSLAGRNYPYAYPQYARDVIATRNAFNTNTAATLTTLGLGAMGAYTAFKEDVSEKYKHFKQLQEYYKREEDARRQEVLRQRQLQRYRTTLREFE